MNPGDTVLVSVPLHERRRRALIKAVITLGIAAGVGFFGFGTRSSDWQQVVALIGVIVAIGAYDTFRTLRRDTQIEQTPESRERKELEEAEARRKAEARERRWYVRYPLAALLLWGAYYIATGPKSDRLWWISIILVVVAALKAWEVTLVAVALGVLFGIFHGIASMPVSVAIIIGALIIASAIRK